jgi:predicted Zn-dependent protease with MMP-like domain
MNRRDFEACVAEALDALPPYFRARLDNVDVVVEDWPDRETLRLAGVSDPAALQGFYHGVPLTERTTHYGLIAPDMISIYRQPIQLNCRNDADVRALVRRVVWHEVAHFFGISDDRLRDLGAY